MLNNRKPKNFEIKSLLLILFFSAFFLAAFFILDGIFKDKETPKTASIFILDGLFKDKETPKTASIDDCTLVLHSNSRETKTVEEFYNIQDYETESYPLNRSYLIVSEESTIFCENTKSLLLDFMLPDSEEKENNRVSLIRNYEAPQNWARYDKITLNVYSDGKGDNFIFIIGDLDGDFWFYEDINLLLQKGWHKLEIPYSSFVIQNDQKLYGNRKRNFDKVRSYVITIQRSPKSYYYSERYIYIENMFLSKHQT
jgi:hypothetical protein